MVTSVGVAASDESVITTDGAMSAPSPAMDAQLATVPPARRSVAELQKVLLANPVAGPPLGKVAKPCCDSLACLVGLT